MNALSPDQTDPALQATVQAKAETAKALLQDIAAHHAPAVFANSLGAEDMVLTDMIFGGNMAISVFSLDTGRLPEETHTVIAAAEKRYGHRIDIIYPRHDLVAETVQTYGINGFYDSIEARKACCQARKVEPLKRVLAGKQAWITGLRAAQSTTRTELKVKEMDEANGLLKFSPLADWSEQEVWAYIHANRVPYNRLHDRNYPSIGCAPCTRAVEPGEDIRAGRWWWENPEQKECGLHLVDGRLQRVKVTA
jgi:phosphoadenosine phosphosulfate reductase